MWPYDGTELPVEVYAAFGADPASDSHEWTWTNLTDRLQPDPIPWRRGASDGSSEVSASTATVVLANDDGALTPLSATSVFWPDVELGTPIWIPLRRVEDGFDRVTASGIGVAESGQTWTVTGGAAADFSTNGSVARTSHGTINILRRMRLDNTLLDTQQTFDVSTSATVTGAAFVTGAVARYVGSGPDYYWGRVEFNAGSNTVALKITRVRGGTLTDLANLGTVPGLTYSANVPLRCRIEVVGDRIAVKAWPVAGIEPAGWQLATTDPDPLTAPGATGLQSWVVAGNTNSPALVASFDNYSVRVDLLNGFADSWLPYFEPTSDGQTRSYIRLTASGILRRLSQGDSAVRSVMARHIPTTDPIAYWPLEDGRDSTVARSGLPGGQPLRVRNGVIDFVDDGPLGSTGSAHPDVDASDALSGTITGGSTAGWQVSIWSKGIVTQEAKDNFLNAFYIPWEIRTSAGWVLRAAHQYEIDEAVGVALFANPTTSTVTETLFLEDNNTPHLNPGITGEWMHLTFSIQQSGADCFVYLNIDEVEVASAVWTGVTIGAPTGVKAISEFGAGQGTSLRMQDVYLSQLSIHNGVSLVPLQQAGMGFPGEAASDRAARVCAERGIAIYVWPGTSEALGPQAPGGDLSVLRDIERVDGLLYERGWGLGYRPNAARYHQTPALTIDLATYRRTRDLRQDQVLQPAYDDQSVRNDWTVSRRNGSSVQVIDEAHIERHGVRDDSAELDVVGDEILVHHASWWVHLGTWREMRYPSIPVDLTANPDLIDGWLSLGVSDRFRVTNGPTTHSTEDVDQLVGGMSATIAPTKWLGSVAGYPARPWDVATEGGSRRVTARGSTVTAAMSASDMEMLVGSTVDNGPWLVGDVTDYPAVFDLAVRVGGEDVEVSEIAPSVVDGMTRTVSNGWGTPDTSFLGTAWAVEGTASNYSVVGGATARMATPATNTLYIAHLDIGSPNAEIEARVTVPVLPSGAPITPRLAGRYTDTANYLEAGLNLMTSGTVQLQLFRRVAGSGSTVSPMGAVTVGSHSAGNAWIIRKAYDGERVYARAWNATTSTDPGHWQVYGEDDQVSPGTRIAALVRRDTSNSNGATNIDWDNIRVLSPQVMTISARGVNGIQRAWAASTSVNVRDRAFAAL